VRSFGDFSLMGDGSDSLSTLKLSQERRWRDLLRPQEA
jgi:hypothetical protein